ncbi:MAG: hypothetical protein ACOY5V_01455 [Pseudomonadota bacterium]
MIASSRQNQRAPRAVGATRRLAAGRSGLSTATRRVARAARPLSRLDGAVQTLQLLGVGSSDGRLDLSHCGGF